MLNFLKANKITNLFLLFFALALQIQISLFAHDDYLGLRVNLADIALPFIGMIILFSLILKKSSWPIFHLKYALGWLTFMGFVLIAALVNTYFNYNEISHWGLVNKIVGWMVLGTYFFIGGWLSFNLDNNQIRFFIKLFVYFFITVLVLQTSLFLLFHLNIISRIALNGFPMTGLMANKNAFTFLYLSVLCLVSIFNKMLFSEKLIYLFWFLLPLVYAFTFARAGLIAFIIILPVLIYFCKNNNWKKIICSFLAGLIIISSIHTLGMNYIMGINHVDGFNPNRNHTYSTLIEAANAKIDGKNISEINQDIKYSGDTMRLDIINTSINMIKKNPLIGTGLGSSTYEQQQTLGQFVNIIDCTPLWLWAETGLIGLGVFLGFYCLSLRLFFRNGQNKNNDEFTQRLNKSLFVILILFGVMCLFHEILYTRFLWLFMGLALANPIKHSKQTA